jgi:nitrate reductase gamma subunit
MAMTVGGIAGVFAFAGLVLLLHRRLFDPRIRNTSSFADIAVLVLLLAQLCLGMLTIPISMHHLDGHEMVKFMNWAQRIVTFRPGAADFVRDVHPVFKLHLTLGMFIFIIFPFTRLVHIWSAPVFYVFRRQYQIVRRRER